MRRRSALAAALSACLALGCGAADSGLADDDGPPTSAVAILDDEHPYAVLEAPDWELNEAVDYRPGHPFSTLEAGLVPATDWYAEYDHVPVDLGGGVISVDYVKIAALEAGLRETAEQFSEIGFVSDEVMVGQVSGRASREPIAPDLDTILLLDAGPRTLLLESGDLTLDELLALAAHLQPVDEAGWTASGGITV